MGTISLVRNWNGLEGRSGNPPATVHAILFTERERGVKKAESYIGRGWTVAGPSCLIEVRSLEEDETVADLARSIPSWSGLWLVVSSREDFQEAVMVADPVAEVYRPEYHVNNGDERLRGLLQYILEPEAERWSPMVVYQRLVAMEAVRTGSSDAPVGIGDIVLASFTDRALSSPRRRPRRRDDARPTAERVAQAARTATRNVDKERRQTTYDCLTAEDDLKREACLARFDEHLYQSARSLNENLMLFQQKPSIALLDHYQDILDQQTRIFLESSLAVESFVINTMGNNSGFDFSIPAAPLWKAVELELNLSLVFFLRRLHHIVDRNPMDVVMQVNSSVRAMTSSGRGIELNWRGGKGKSELQGLTLGDLYHIAASLDSELQAKLRDALGDATRLAAFVFEKKTEDGPGLPKILAKIRDIRNRNAHSSSMEKRSLASLKKAILSPDCRPEESTLGRILELKRVLHAATHQSASS